MPHDMLFLNKHSVLAFFCGVWAEQACCDERHACLFVAGVCFKSVRSDTGFAENLMASSTDCKWFGRENDAFTARTGTE